jgi:hypothetical protein
MLDPTSLESPLANHRYRIWQLYKAGDLTAEMATVQLLRLDIDEIMRARALNGQTDPAQTGSAVSV